MAQAKIASEHVDQQVLVIQEKFQILRMRHQHDKEGLEEDNVGLIQKLSQSKEELRSNSHQISLLQDIMGQMYYLSKEMLDSRPPSNVYTLFLQDKWYEFQLNRLKEKLPHNLEKPQEFTKALQQCSEEKKE